jgi:hypothetical protein
MRRSEWLELLSSIHYIKHISRPDAHVDEKTIGSHLQRAGKGSFSPVQIEEAWQKLDQLGLVKMKALPPPTTHTSA